MEQVFDYNNYVRLFCEKCDNSMYIDWIKFIEIADNKNNHNCLNCNNKIMVHGLYKKVYVQEVKGLVFKDGRPYEFKYLDNQVFKNVWDKFINNYNTKKKENIFRKVSRYDRFEVLKRQNWSCNICGCKLKYSSKNNWEAEIAHIDHIHPFSKAESYKNGIDKINELSNLQALCPKCNLTKSKKELN